MIFKSEIPTPVNPMRENKDVKQDEKCERVNDSPLDHMIKKPSKRNIFNGGSVALALLHKHKLQKFIKRNWLLWITYILMEPSLN